MRIFHEDARTFIPRAAVKNDVNFGDVFKSLYTIPWHLTTVEAVQKTYGMLNEGGCVLLNIISSVDGDAGIFLGAELATYRDVFPYVYVFAVSDPGDLTTIQSTILAAVKTSIKPLLRSEDKELAGYLANEVTDLIAADLPPLTDEHAPVDYFTNKAIK
jgi:spermidine synthase